MDGQLRELYVNYDDKSYMLSVRLRPSSNDLIVFLHGWGGSKECFAEAFASDALKESGDIYFRLAFMLLWLRLFEALNIRPLNLAANL